MSEPDWIAEVVAELPSLCTVAEAARLLRVSSRTVHRKLATGELRSVRGRQSGSAPNLIPRSELGRYLRSLETAA
ncbi:MAG: helix-turn-helix domain-containing protein [Myxococcota bacterium]|nr:helix-turn-helix domain-containing protein [Myxococcota bacterium]